MKQALPRTSKPSRGCRGIAWRAGLNRFQSCVLRSPCAHYSRATGSQEMKGCEQDQGKLPIQVLALEQLVVFICPWTGDLDADPPPRTAVVASPGFVGRCPLAGDASLQLCKAGTLDVSPALYDSVNDSKTKLIGDPKPLFVAQKCLGNGNFDSCKSHCI